METKIMLSKQQLREAHVLRNYNEGQLSRQEAAKALKLSTRQISRKAKALREGGEAALIHRNTGRKPVHALTEEAKGKIIRLRQQEVYEGCNIQHFKECLATQHAISISYKALYNLLTEAGIKSPKKHHKARKAHRSRKRKAMAGEMIQLDATPKEWFGSEEKFALHGGIDDASSAITGLYMTQNECLAGYQEVMRQTVLNHGVPLSAYTDRHTIFRSPKTAEKELAGEEANLTQFGRALAELGVNIIHAHSPQAKGRIERLWGTLQSRLPVEFRIHGITTVEAANEFLQNEYIPRFNKQFALETEGSIFVPFQHGSALDDILCVKETRKMDNAGSFSYKGQRFTVLDKGYPLIPAKASVTLLISLREGLRVEYKDRIFNVTAAPAAPKATTAPKATPSPRKRSDAEPRQSTEPLLKHSSEAWKHIWHQESYAESLAFLFDLFLKNDSHIV
jgi:transposase